jgi:hypothetical protein
LDEAEVTVAGKQSLSTVEFTTGELKQLPSHHSGFLACSCLAIDEIAVLQKVLLLALNSRSRSRNGEEAVQEITFANSLIVQRNLSAKLLEYHNLLGDYVKRCKRGKSVELQEFVASAEQATSRFREGAEYELALWYRNTVTSHYLVSVIASLIQGGDLGDEERAHPIYLHERDGNSAYVLGEQVLLAKLAENGASPIEKLDRFSAWVLDMAKRAMANHHTFCIALLETYFPEKVAVEFRFDLDKRLLGELTDTYLPALWNISGRPPRG